ncbi:Alpha-glucosidase yihQ [Hordeum vulgare]|nr:Alpha-glucosidase yihQ [Hordeum vulgare]
MVVHLALRRSREAAARRQRSDSLRRESIASAQPVLGYGVAASPEAMQSVWRSNIVAEAQPLRWRVEHEAWPSTKDVMARPARRARQRAQDAAVDVRETESHSPSPHRMHQCGRRNRVMVDVGSSQEGSVIDLMSTVTVQVTGSVDEE